MEMNATQYEKLWRCNLRTGKCYMLVSDIAMIFNCSQDDMVKYFKNNSLKESYISYSNKNGEFPIGDSGIPSQEMCVTLDCIREFLQSQNLFNEEKNQILTDSHNLARHNYYLD